MADARRFAARAAAVDEAERLHGSGDTSGALERLHRTEFDADERGGDEFARYCAVYGSALAASNQFHVASLYLEAAAPLHERAEHWEELGAVHLALGSVFGRSGGDRLARRAYGSAIECFERAGRLDRAMRARVHLGHLQVRSGDLDGARRQRDALVACRAEGREMPADVSASLDVLHAQLASESARARRPARPVHVEPVALPPPGHRSGGGRPRHAAVPPWTAPLVQIDDAGREASTLVDTLHDAARPLGGNLVVTHGRSAYAAAGAGLDGFRWLDAVAFRGRDLDSGALANSSLLSALRSIAGRVCRAGVLAREAGDLQRSLEAYGFALRVALLLGDPQGIRMLASNLVSLRGCVDAALCGRNVRAEGRLTDDARARLGHVRDGICAVADEVVAGVERELDDATRREDHGARLDLLLAIRRLLLARAPNSAFEQKLLPAWAGGGVLGKGCDDDTVRRRAILLETEALAVQLGAAEAMRAAIFEELTRVHLSELLELSDIGTEVSERVAAAADVRTAGPTAGDAGFVHLWSMYLRWRPMAASTDPKSASLQCQLAADHFVRLRALAVCAGTGSGHVASYAVAQYAAVLGRDLCGTHLRLGDVESALVAAEATVSRALVDWMGRTHLNNRLVVREGFTGSIGEVETASIDEIRLAARMAGAPILLYLALDGGFGLWCVEPDGAIAFDWIADAAPLVERLMGLLPYGIDADAVCRGERQLGPAAPADVDRADLDEALDALGAALLPERARAALARPSRVVIIADRELAFVPFAALRVSGRYLVEGADVLHWPSVTAWILCDTQVELWSRGVATARDPIVVGDPDFSGCGTATQGGAPMHLAPLPGSLREAREVAGALGVTPLVHEAATFDGILRQFGHASTSREAGGRTFVPVLHIASHGLVLMERPESSFVALADRPVTAWFLYTFDPGLRSHLVMLSCCQTGLGAMHIDSPIGLANAFLVAGACAVGSTLWKVSDDATGTLMARLYDELPAAASLSAALALAQRAFLGDPSTCHPLLWAAFRISGSDRPPAAAVRSPRSPRSSST